MRDADDVIDTHAHLGDDAAEVLDARARRGRRRGSSTSRRRSPARARRSRSPSAHDGVYACLGIHPHEAGGADAASSTELRALLAHPKAVAVGETGLDYFRDYAPHDAQQRLFDAPARARARRPASRSSSTPAPPTTTRSRALARARRPGDPPLLLVAGRCSSPRSSAAGTSRSPATSPTRTRTTCARRRGACRPTGCSPRPTARTSRRRPCAAGATSPPTSCTRYAALAEARGVDADELAAQIDANADAVFGL